MKRQRVAVLAASMAMAAIGVMAGPLIAGSAYPEARASTPQQPAQQQPAPEKVAIPVRERSQEEIDRELRYLGKIPEAIKNRAGGERAHRRWRKQRSRGRR